MPKLPRLAAALAALALLVSPSVPAMERAQVPERLTWNLTDLFPSEQAWEAALKDVQGRIPRLAALKGTLGASAEQLRRALDTWMTVSRDASRVSVYASMLSDQDTRDSRGQAMKQRAEQMQVDLGSATAWIRPQLIALGEERIRALVTADPGLAPYRPMLDDIVRRAPHTLSAEDEALLASLGNVADTGHSIYETFTGAEMPFPEVSVSTGEKVRLDPAGFTRWRAESNRADRLVVYRAFFARYQDFRRTLASTLAGQVQAHDVARKARKFESSVQAALFNDNVPVAIYRQLLDDVHANLPTLHRYLALRQRLMGVERLGYEDLYAPIVPRVDLRYTPEVAQAITLEAFAPLGPEYVDALRKGYANRWVDFLPSTGKRQGAYSTGVFGVHPYQLLNYNGRYEDLSTLAHESGHSMHTFLSDTSQPYVTHDYATFVAEVASTLNENLLFHHMLKSVDDDDTRLFLLGSYLDNLRHTLFRQTLFAEFELAVHEKVEKGEPLTGDDLNKLYLGLVRRYYGHDQGVCQVDDVYAVEWAYIPHFYYNFYVYQYATSVVAAVSLANGILSEPPGSTQRRDAYLTLLKSGSSDYPVKLLERAGVNMRTSGPFKAAMAEMNRIMDEMDRILTKRPKT
jgi:oligoendopeptidase F